MGCASSENTLYIDPSAAPPSVFFVLGGPGSGKGTQCANLVRDYPDIVHLSAGDLLRAERDSGSKEAELINLIIKKGKIVPAEITVLLLRKAMLANGWSKKHFLIDGFPRNIQNQEGWEKIMGDKVHMKFMLFLECSEETMLERIMSRAAAAGDAKRKDDNEETAKKRFKTFTNDTMPVVKAYEEQGKVRTVSAAGTPDEIYAEIKKVFDGVV